MNPNIKRYLYDLQYKIISRSIYSLIAEYKRTSYYYILSIKKKFYRIGKRNLIYWKPLIKS